MGNFVIDAVLVQWGTCRSLSLGCRRVMMIGDEVMITGCVAVSKYWCLTNYPFAVVFGDVFFFGLVSRLI